MNIILHLKRGKSSTLIMKVSALVLLFLSHSIAYGEVLNISVSDILYTQESISPQFTNGKHVNAVINDLNEGTTLVTDFPRIRVQPLAHGDGQVYYHSFDNRRSYVFKNSKFADSTIEVETITQEERINEIWKVTSQSDGWNVTLTNSPDKTLRPPQNSFLGDFREAVEGCI